MVEPDKLHLYLRDNMKQKLAYSDDNDFDEWKSQVREKLSELTGINVIKQNACPKHYETEYVQDCGTYTKTRFVVETERNNFVPCYLLVPNTGKDKYPVAIVEQGHTKGGMYHSIGETRCEKDEQYQPRGAFAFQAMENGFAALCIELRGMGELEPQGRKRQWGDMCKYTAHTALILGRTLLGERMWDVSKVIDVLGDFAQLDTDNIVMTGVSGGGTITFYASCYDERIKLSAPCCAFCPFAESIIEMYHCICNYVPHAYEWYDMQDLSCLIAPRKLLIINGEQDEIFPLDGTLRGYETAQKIFAKAGAKDNCKLVLTPYAHYWAPEYVWNNILEMMNK